MAVSVTAGRSRPGRPADYWPVDLGQATVIPASHQAQEGSDWDVVGALEAQHRDPRSPGVAPAADDLGETDRFAGQARRIAATAHLDQLQAHVRDLDGRVETRRMSELMAGHGDLSPLVIGTSL